MSQPVLVFGANGQVGRELIGAGRTKDIAIVGATRVDADITDLDAVLHMADRVKPRFIVNAAAYTAVDKAESEADRAYAVNAQGAENIARAAARIGAELVQISTDYVFDGRKTGAYDETSPIAPLGVYGKSKADGEARIRAVCPDAMILRTAWVYSRHGTNFLKTMMRLAATRERLRVVSDQHGCPTAAVDIAEAILAIAEHGIIKGGLFHFAGPDAVTWHRFAEDIVAEQAGYTGKSPPVDAIITDDYPTLARRPMNSSLDSTRFIGQFGYCAAPRQQRIRETVGLLMTDNETSWRGGA